MKMFLYLLIFFVLISSVYAEKVYIFEFNYDNGKLTLKDQLIKEGYYPDRNIVPEEGYKCTLFDKVESNFYSFKFDIPNTLHLDVIEGDSMMGGVIVMNNTDFSFIMPYSSEVSNLVCYNKGGYEVLREPTVGESLSPEKKGNSFLWVFSLVGFMLLVFVLYRIKNK